MYGHTPPLTKQIFLFFAQEETLVSVYERLLVVSLGLRHFVRDGNGRITVGYNVRGTFSLKTLLIIFHYRSKFDSVILFYFFRYSL